MWKQMTVYVFSEAERFNMTPLIQSFGPVNPLLIDVIVIPEEMSNSEAIDYMEKSFKERKTQLVLLPSGHPRAVYAAQMAYAAMVPVVLIMFDFMVDSMAATQYSSLIIVNDRKSYNDVLDANRLRGRFKPEIRMVGNNGEAIRDYVVGYAKRTIK